jgi:hypothetical protein
VGNQKYSLGFLRTRLPSSRLFHGGFSAKTYGVLPIAPSPLEAGCASEKDMKLNMVHESFLIVKLAMYSGRKSR